MAQPRITTVIAAGVASAVAFTVITRSGLAGTLAGAAVASMVITGATHGLVHVFDRLALWWQRRRAGETGVPPDVSPSSWTDGKQIAAPTRSAMSGVVHRPRWQKRAVLVAPYLLAVGALGVSGYSLVTGKPIERVIVRESVVQPGTTVISVVTVTVPVTVPGGAPGGSGTTLPGTPGSTTTTAVAATTTTSPPGSSTTSTAPPSTTPTTKSPAPTTTTAPFGP